MERPGRGGVWWGLVCGGGARGDVEEAEAAGHQASETPAGPPEQTEGEGRLPGGAVGGAS